jgi:hypothetical protein
MNDVRLFRQLQPQTLKDVPLESLIVFINKLREDPVLASEVLLKLPLAPHERVALRGMWKAKWILNVWGRGCGKSFLAAVYGLLRCLLYPSEKIVIVGPSFRQSILVFAEAEKWINRAPYAKDALADRPKHGTSEYKMTFKNDSTFIALPLGADGGKIRGTRATVIIIDEAAIVPSEIIDMAITPFMTTYKNPMAGYLGIDDDDAPNVLVFSSSANYQFNHLYQKYVYWLKQIHEEQDSDYFLSKFNYHDTPERFIDMKVVEMQKATSPDIIFRMEYLAEFPQDSIGFFPASLIQKKCLTRFVVPLKEGRKGYKYVLGLDPARSEDYFGIVVLELEGEHRNVVRVEAYKGKPFPVMKDKILDLLERFDIVRIGCDAYGGGRAIADLLAQEHSIVNRKTGIIERRPPILVVGDKEQRAALGHGREILDLIVFSSPSIAEMNYDLKARMEHGLLRIPATPFSSEEIDEDAEDVFEDVQQLVKELESVAVEPTTGTSGYLKFDVPLGMNKDRYSALLVANKAADTFNFVPKKIILPTALWA